MTNLNGQTLDILQENINKLCQLFPEVITEDKIDFDKLKQILGEYVDDSKERYNFTWNSKGKALRISQTPSSGTLRPCPEESKNWDSTENLYIEGDNLEVLKLLQKSYHNKIKMIYIDPPYNTGGDFVYPDDFFNSIENYKRITGQVDVEGNNISTNTEANGRFHTDWLNMMYPRLRLARNLLLDDGVIFISIDDNEVCNIQKLCNEVFGESNFIANLIWQKKTGAADAKAFAVVTEYILVYGKTEKSIFSFTKNKSSYDINRYRYEDEYINERGPFYYDNLDRGTLGYHESLDYAVETPDGGLTYPNGRTEQFNDGWRWKWSKEKLLKGLKEGFIELKKSNDKKSGWGVYYKIYLNVDNDGNRIERAAPHKNLILNTLNTHAANESKQIFGTTVLFSNPKPVELIKLLISYVELNPNDIVLDFFSGSATTAHAVIQLNAEDGGNRKFIMVQLPEPCDKNGDAAKAGYKNICEIGKERIRRVGDIIKEELENGDKQLTLGMEEKKQVDIGFKVFKLDTSNLKKWQPDYDNLEKTLIDSISNFVDGRSEMDVVYEIMIKMGLNLTYPVEEKVIGGKKVYYVGFGALMICLADEITTDVANGMVQLQKELQPEAWKVVFKDNGFKSDSNKTNIKEILKCAGLEEDAFTTI